MNYKILVADDSPSIQKLIKISFPADEFEIFAFSDGQEVLDSLSRINPDAILINQEELAQVPLILINEAFEPLDKDRLESFEFDKLVQKPFDSDALVQKVRSIIEERKIPMTLPEEPVWDEDASDDMNVELDEKIRELVKQEILEVERELEKRIKARILAELKMWLINNQKK